jgi:alpha-amylase
MKNFRILMIAFAATVGLTSCNENENIAPKIETIPAILKAGNTSGVMMQGFYWDVPAGGNWWNTIRGKASAWAAAGITAVWLPPSNKCQSGPNSDGYDPYDYFDFGNYNQMGTTETRYGSKDELNSLITTAHNSGLKVYADIVMNHNAGGSLQANPNTGGNTYTSFIVASGLFHRGYNDFHPSTYEQSDAGVFGSYPDLCHANPYVSGWLWSNANSVAKYYKNTMKYDGWRFDYVKGFAPSNVKNFVASAGGFAVGECWDANVSVVQSYVNASGTSAFDFPCYYALEAAFINNNLAALRDNGMLCKNNPGKAVTFVANHDINNIYNNKLSAYAYILTHEGTPCIFYRDYEEWLDKNKLNNLIWINKNLAAGTTTVLYADNDEYIAKMSGSPGLVVYINNSGSTLSRSVTTNWVSNVIKDYTGNVGGTLTTSASKVVTASAPANSYSVWSTQ